MPNLETISFEKADFSDKEEILDYAMEDFMKEETLSVAIGASPNEEWRRIWGILLDSNLQEPIISYVARDKSQANRLVGVRLSKITTAADFLDFPTRVAKLTFEDPIIRKRVGIIQKFLVAVDMNDEMATSSKLLHFNMLGVRKEYQNLGVGSKLSLMSIAAGRDCGCDHAVAFAVSLKAQRLFEKIGLTRRRSIKYTDLTDAKPQDGTVAINIYYNSLL